MTDYYPIVRDKIDQQYQALSETYEEDFNCALGCHSCCLPDLGVSPIEARAIKAHLASHPDLVERLRSLDLADPHQGTRCRLLDSDGHCMIYEVRPFMCRSHGAPHLIQIDEKREGIDACHLNFTRGFDHLAPGDWINLENLNVLLALMNQYEAREKGDPESALPSRVKLTIEALMND